MRRRLFGGSLRAPLRRTTYEVRRPDGKQTIVVRRTSYLVHGHALIPAALITAILITLSESGTLYLLSLSGAAAARAALAAVSATASLIAFPLSASSASVLLQGTGATPPRTIRASETVLPLIFNAAAQLESAQSNERRSRAL